MSDRPAITPELAAQGFLTDDQTRKRLNVTSITLRQWRHLGQGPRFYKIGRHVYYRATDIADWIERQAVVPTPKAAPVAPLKPWDAAGMTRATWYRHGKPSQDQAPSAA